MPNLLVAITASPASEPLDFLRDVFVCSLLAPLLIFTLRRNRAFYGVAVGVLVLVGFTTNFLHTPNILLLYSVGIYVANLDRVPALSPRIVFVSWLALAGLGLTLGVYEIKALFDANGYHTTVWLDVGLSVIRLPAAVAFWSLALRFSRSGPLSRLGRLEPFIFTAFCCHLLVTTVIWVFWQKALGNYYDPAYPLFFFFVPFAVMIAAVVFAETANRYTRSVFSLLNGGRSLEAASFLKESDLRALRTRITRQLPDSAT
jgi:hypothetical protein